MAFEEQCDGRISLPSWIRTASGGAKRASTEFIPRLDLSAVRSCSNSINSFPNQSSFGSPIAVMGGFEQKTSSDDDHDSCSGFLTSLRPCASTIPEKQSSAQLTIFYGGTVTVYDDIPADKAQAIMLMASSANCSSYPQIKVQNGCGPQTEQKISVPVMKLSEGSGIHAQPASDKVNKDIPIARKHSLRRFLEKRKDRVNAKAQCPYKTAESGNPEPDKLPSSSSYAVLVHVNAPPV